MNITSIQTVLSYNPTVSFDRFTNKKHMYANCLCSVFLDASIVHFSTNSITTFYVSVIFKSSAFEPLSMAVTFWPHRFYCKKKKNNCVYHIIKRNISCFYMYVCIGKNVIMLNKLKAILKL